MFGYSGFAAHPVWSFCCCISHIMFCTKNIERSYVLSINWWLSCCFFSKHAFERRITRTCRRFTKTSRSRHDWYMGCLLLWSLMPCWWDKVKCMWLSSICGWNMRNTTKLRHHHEILCANMSFLLLFLLYFVHVLLFDFFRILKH